MKKPNIVFITTDTQGRKMVSAYGNRPCVETPNIDRMAREGVLFENAFTASPLCTPARSSWYTGLHPSRNGAWCNNVTVRRETPMLAEILARHGYRTKHLGKWHLDGGSYNGGGQSDGGFDADTWYDISSFHQETKDPSVEYPNRFKAWNRGTEDIAFCFGHRVADRAIGILNDKSQTGQPLFLAVEFDEPHGPYITPPPYRGRYAWDDIPRPATINADMSGKPKIQREYSAFLRASRSNPDDLPAYYKRYYECNTYVDHEIGRVLDAVRGQNDRDTVVIYTSDHGDHLGAFGLCAKGPTAYDNTTAVPLIVWGPHLTEGGRQEAGVVSSIDVFSTILDLAHVDASSEGCTEKRGYTCRSLLPVLDGSANEVRDHAIIDYNRFGIGNTEDDGFYPIRAIRTCEWKLVVNLFDTDELYDVGNDPDEAHNQIDDDSVASIRDELHDRLLEWQEQTKDPFRGPQWGQRPWRADFKHAFVGLLTTGWKDAWKDGDFDTGLGADL